MKFYNRNDELKQIRKIIAKDNADFVYIYGRRRIGKTSLILEAFKDTKFLYFFVGDNTKQELLNNFTEILRKSLNLNYLNFKSFKELLDFLFSYSKENKLIVVFDEFQNFFKIEASIFSDFQYFWDLNHQNSKIKIFCLGSNFTLMKKIFEDYSNPLFGRKSASFYLKKFDINTQVEILKDYKQLSAKNLLYFYSIFNGIPKYIKIFFNNFSNKKDFLEEILDNFLQENSFFLFEGKELFIVEFGKSYDIYFSILASIAIGKNRKGEISGFTGISTDSLGFYLQKLEKYFELIERKVPIGENNKSKVGYYSIKDSFLIFWFRYIYKYSYLLEIKQFDKLTNIIKDDINTFLGFELERVFREIFILENLKKSSILPFNFEYINPLFNKKGDEIDLVLLNKKEKKVLFIESKLNTKKIDSRLLYDLKEKVKNFGKFKNYKKYYGFVSLEKINYNFDENVFLYSLEEFLN